MSNSLFKYFKSTVETSLVSRDTHRLDWCHVTAKATPPFGEKNPVVTLCSGLIEASALRLEAH